MHESVNGLHMLSLFFNAIADDPRVSSTHIGIYAALLQYWVVAGCPYPLKAFSYEIMSLAKVSAPSTFYKTVRDLASFGYIRYEASYKRNQGSKVFIIMPESNFGKQKKKR